MKYKDYDIDHFVTDEFFIQWIKNPNENNSHFWEKWITEHPEKRTLVNEAAHLIRSVKYLHNPEFTDRMYVETFEHILKADHDRQVVPPTVVKRTTRDTNFFSFFTLRGIAASLLILFCLWVQYDAFHYNPEPLVVAEIPMITRSNPAGVKSIIDLPDGSRIHLNSKSEIEFPQEFSADLRSVRLKGEAFFEIEKEQRPFLVESGNAQIQVLGTSFNVNQRENGALYVALVTGKVSVNTDNGSRMTLNPNEMLVLEKGGTYRKMDFDPNSITAWKNNLLVFKSSNLSEIKEKLENWYGVTISLEGKIDKNWTYTGTYNDEMLENVLRGISTTSGMSYRIENKKIILTNPR